MREKHSRQREQQCNGSEQEQAKEGRRDEGGLIGPGRTLAVSLGKMGHWRNSSRAVT